MDMTLVQVVVVVCLGLLGGVGLIFGKLQRKADEAVERTTGDCADAGSTESSRSPRTVGLRSAHASDKASVGVGDNFRSAVDRYRARVSSLDETLSGSAQELAKITNRAPDAVQHPLDAAPQLPNRWAAGAGDRSVAGTATRSNETTRSDLPPEGQQNDEASLAEALAKAQVRIDKLESEVRSRSDLKNRLDASARRSQALTMQVQEVCRERDVARRHVSEREQALAELQYLSSDAESVTKLRSQINKEVDSREKAEQRIRALERVLDERNYRLDRTESAAEARAMALETRAFSAEREVETLKATNARQLESLHAREEMLLSSQASVATTKRLKKVLTKAELALEAAQVSNKQLAERADAAVEHALILEAEKASLTDALAERESELAQMRRDTPSIQNVSTELERSKQRVLELDVALERAQIRANEAGDTDLELRRVKSELAALESERAKAAEFAADFDRHVGETGNEGVDAAEFATLESELLRRDKRIAELEARLTESTQSVSSPLEHLREVESMEPAIGDQVGARLVASSAKRDNLQKIRGVGPVMERTLNGLGITTFLQIARFTPEDVERVSAQINAFPGRIERDDWIGSARCEHEREYPDSVDA